MTTEEIIMIEAWRRYKAAKTPQEAWIMLCNVFQALTAAEEGCTQPPLCPVQVKSETDPSQDMSNVLQLKS